MKDVNLSVNVFPIEEPQGNTMAFASVAVDDLIAIRGIRVVDGENGLFVSMPQSQDKKTGEFHDIAFPINADLRKAMENTILDKYAAEKGINRPEKRPSLNVRVTEGKKKAAEQAVNQREAVAAKSHGSALE
jgi:stage V sporulation protein G